jgi:hypothetical protein
VELVGRSDSAMGCLPAVPVGNFRESNALTYVQFL